MGENALYRLKSAPIMGRVGRSVNASRKEIDVARWLESYDFPSVRSADVEQVIVVGGMSVTFWEFIEPGGEPIVAADLGRRLRELYEIPPSPYFTLPSFQPMPKVDERLRKIGALLSEEDRNFLTGRKAELDRRFAEITFELKPGPIHGDAHRDNLIRDAHSGVAKLIDLEDFCYGPREWDLCVEAIGYQAFGWITESDYLDYVDECGFDPIQWSGFPTVRAIRELNMTTWLAQRLGQSKDVDAEVKKRINDLRNDDAPRQWGAF